MSSYSAFNKCCRRYIKINPATPPAITPPNATIKNSPKPCRKENSPVFIQRTASSKITSPVASLNKDSKLNDLLMSFGISKPLVTDSSAVASVGVTIAAKANENGNAQPMAT